MLALDGALCYSAPLFRTPSRHWSPYQCPSRVPPNLSPRHPAASCPSARSPIRSGSRPESRSHTGATRGRARGALGAAMALAGSGSRRSGSPMISNPPHVLSYWQAQEAARKLARRQPGEAVDESRPLTVAEALDAYEKDLKTRGASKYNAGRVRLHLSGVLLSKPIALLDANELKRWRDSLIEKLAPASVNRTVKVFRAALEIA